jgi:crotonobetainyl-CoA:carnitine CoA-transferase CaiB-like acyl-CoA transferase
VAARFQNTHEYYALRAEALLAKTTAHWLEVFRKRDIPAAPYHTLDSLIDDPHLADVGLLRQREHPSEGTLLDLEPANTLSEGHRRAWRPAPGLGEHTESVLREAGYADETIAALLATGAARGPKP